MKLVVCLITIHLVFAQKPITAYPTANQLKWHDLSYYGFIHFGPNSFTDKEWGDGTEKETVFNPSALDCHQWAKICKEAGMKGIILTAKHHDGFVLYPSAFSKHTVRESPWKNGQGDVLKELSEACKAYALNLAFIYHHGTETIRFMARPLIMMYT